MRWHKKSLKTTLGITIAPSHIAIVQSRVKRGRLKILSYASSEIAPGVVNQWQILKPSEVVDTIRSLMNQAAVNASRVAFSINDAAYIERQLNYPANYTALEIESRIQLEASDLLPFPLADVAYDFAEMSVDQESERDGLAVSQSAAIQPLKLVMVRRQNVETLKQIARDLKLNLIAIDIERYAVSRFYQHTLGISNNAQLFAYLEISRHNLTCACFSSGELVGSKLQANSENSFGNESQNLEDLVESAVELLKRLVLETKQSADSHFDLNQSFGKLLIVGDANCDLDALASNLQQRLALPVEPFPFRENDDYLPEGSRQVTLTMKYWSAAGLTLHRHFNESSF